ncbi:MAG: hypothetical protein WA125_02320 [Desulfosporosinus sp.]
MLDFIRVYLDLYFRDGIIGNMACVHMSVELIDLIEAAMIDRTMKDWENVSVELW